MRKFIIYSDGGARGNPGPAAIGYVIFENGIELIREKKFIGEATNNQAEYEALVQALSQAVSLGGQEVWCYLDSELVVKQLKGLYKVRDIKLKPKTNEVFRLSSKFKSLIFEHVPREKNKLADQLVNEALDEKGF